MPALLFLGLGREMVHFSRKGRTSCFINDLPLYVAPSVQPCHAGLALRGKRNSLEKWPRAVGPFVLRGPGWGKQAAGKCQGTWAARPCSETQHFLAAIQVKITTPPVSTQKVEKKKKE